MSQKTIDIPGIGEVVLAKRRGSRSLRLTIQPDGRVRVGMPYWAPYSMAIKFALSKSDWINRHAQKQRYLLTHGSRIGKSYRLEFVARPVSARVASTRLGSGTIRVASHLDLNSAEIQAAAAKACERALKKEAQDLLSRRLERLAAQNGFKYRGLRIKRLTSRWGSCSADDVITLNYFLTQLPWNLIDYVILHELVHTRQRSHSPSFWAQLEAVLPGAKQLRREIRRYRPVLLPQ